MPAFVLYGEFLWPPVARLEGSDQQAEAETRRGAIEVHLRDRNAGLPASIAIRWRPLLSGTGDVKLVGEDTIEWPELELFSLSADDALAMFRGLGEEQELSFLIDSDGDGKHNLKTGSHPWLSFRGGFLLDMNYEGVPRRWPLVRRCSYAKSKQEPEVVVHSTFGVGLDKPAGEPLVPYFRFNLHLPLPLARTTHKDRPNARAFPFAAKFTAKETTAKTMKVSTLVGGWVGFSDAEDNVPGVSFVFENIKNLPDPRLGSFGFAAVANDKGKGGFAGYAGNPEVTLANYWPDQDSAVQSDLLGRFGFAVSSDPIELKPPKAPADLSLRFRPKPEPGGAGYIYRTGLTPGPPTKDTNSQLFGGAGQKWQFRLEEETGGTVAIENKSRLAVDAELSWQIDDQHIWSRDRARDWSPRLRLFLHYEAWWRGLDPPTQTLSQAMLSNGKASLAAARSGLFAVEGAEPRSFLPTLKQEALPNSTYLAVRPAFYSPWLPLDVDADGQIGWETPARRVRLRMTLADKEDLIPAELPKDNAENELNLIASEMTFFDTAGVEARLTLKTDSDWIPETVEDIAQGEPYFASYKIRKVDVRLPKDATSWSGRLGGLQFEGVGRVLEKAGAYLRLGGPGAPNQSAFGAPKVSDPGFLIAAQLHLPLRAFALSDVGAPVAKGDRSGRRGPVVIPETPEKTETPEEPKTPEAPAPTDSKGQYDLWVTESVAPTADRLLKAQVFVQTPSTGEQTYTILNETPLSIFRFTRIPIDARGDASSVEVGVYSSDDRVFRYRSVSDTYRYVLPPQSIGESADKPGRLEIHDSTEVAPYASAGNPPLRQRAVQFRLTPPAEMWIRPSDVERGYFLPEAMTYELFRQAGGLGFGAALAFLRAEFLYGLPVGISTRAETGTARLARVAEIEALVGQVMGPLGPQPGDDSLGQSLGRRWQEISDAVARRPERLDIWEPGASDRAAFSPARFSEGASFALRRTALIRKPVLAPGEVEAPGPSDLSLRFHPQGLAGGALWPVEQLGLLEALQANPSSDGGEIEGIALSPFGGDAAQKVRLLNGLVTIESLTVNGRVQRHKVKVLGRIRAFWHRAQHVVVYERTTSPSAQFSPREEGPPKRTRSRRPILRKVSEYIELLQPERSYPDSPAAQVQSAGFLRKVRFNTTLIPVDSAWAQEVPSSAGKPGAWTVPLWNRHAARERPQVYSMPDIAFVTAGDGEEAEPETIQQCLDPDIFEFFADFSETTDQTDLWPSRIVIDYPEVLPGSALIEAIDGRGQVEDPARRRRGVSRILPGLRGFTWRLAPAAQKTMINAGRSDQPVYVGLESVTFMRGGSRPLDKDESAAFVGILKAAKNAEYVAMWPEDATQVPAFAQDFATSMDKLVADLKSKQSPQTIKDALEALRGKVEETMAAPKGEIGKVADALKSNSNAAQIAKLVAGEAIPCDALKTKAVVTIRAKRMLIGTAIADWVAEANDVAAWLELTGQIWDKTYLIKRIVEKATMEIRPLFSEATQDIARLREGVEKARASVGTFGEDAAAVVARARTRVHEVRQAYDGAKPWSPQRLASLTGDIDAAILGLAEDIGVAVDEAHQRLAVDLGAAGQTVAGHVAAALQGVETVAKDAFAKTSAAREAFKLKAEDIGKQLDTLLSPDGMKGALPEAKKKIAEVRTKVGNLNDPQQKKTVEDALNAADVLLLKASGTVQTARSELEAATASIDLEKVDAVISLASDALKDAIVDAGKAADTVIEAVKDLAGDIANGIKADVDALAKDLQDYAAQVVAWLAGSLSAYGKFADPLVDKIIQELDGALTAVNGALTAAIDAVDAAGSTATATVETIEGFFEPDKMAGFVAEGVLKPVVTRRLQPFPDKINTAGLQEVRKQLENLSAEVTQALATAEATILDGLGDLTDACEKVFNTVKSATETLEKLAANAENWLQEQIDNTKYHDAVEALNAVVTNATELANQAEALADQFDQSRDSVRVLYNDLAAKVQEAKGYGDRVLDLAANIGKGGLSASPSNILKLYSAVSSPPEIAALKANLDKMRAEFDELDRLIKTTRASALFGKLGDALKGMDISLPFDGITDRLMPPDLSNLDIGKVFAGFGGAKLKHLLRGVKLPKGVQDSVRLTHGFDKKAARAWVQIDIDARMPGRKALFSFGPFKSDFLNARLVGQVRFEVSKDTPDISETGYGRIETTIDMGVSGQSIVKFENFALAFSREAGLDVQFDPKGIRLNPQFRMIQEFMETIFPDEVGGIEILKEDNIPVGLQHVFMTPPLGANAITSGVSNIAIGNTFALRAYPDFVLSDTFNLASEERPFIFSIFVLGCTGYMSASVIYQPIDNKLAVDVTAAVGGSAQLAIDAGPFSGAVYITLSGVLTYSKKEGASGGALTIGMTLVIAGSVRVMGMITVLISVVLRISYQDNGRIDASGTLSVTIRISRFFKIRARAGVKYKLKDGKSQTTISSSVSADGEAVDKANKATKALKSLEKLKNVTAGGMA